ncbi:hypothetical protein O181_120041 [Austropuccinia psidii MF-1]|uniref:Uncharacterized protein n=1 Tax=Austropuccinia psidii MF-1 TaxID=1389203 RepID=A0A9Q3Q086_9BASI|nr:hypothetical protein [Austropuccinia psidii MF-1]
MESTFIQATNKTIKEYHSKRRETRKGKASVGSTRKPQVNPPSQKGKKKLGKPYFTSYRIPKIQKAALENIFSISRMLIEFKDKEEERMRQPHFTKK